MAKTGKQLASELRLEKCPTGISGLDEITEGGLPRGRPTLICGSAGCGKTLLATNDDYGLGLAAGPCQGLPIVCCQQSGPGL